MISNIQLGLANITLKFVKFERMSSCSNMGIKGKTTRQVSVTFAIDNFRKGNIRKQTPIIMWQQSEYFQMLNILYLPYTSNSLSEKALYFFNLKKKKLIWQSV